MSIEFQWQPEDFKSLVESCDRDTATPYILKYMPKNGVILEAGCGLARYVEFLSQRGFKVLGVELSKDAIDMVKTMAPHLDVRQGNILRLDFKDETISGIICLGVVEHFVEGPEKPLKEIWRVLKPGSYAVITVPSFNLIRKMKYYLRPYLSTINPVRIAKQSRIIRRLFGKKPIHKRAPIKFTYHPGAVPYRYRQRPELEGFFEYLFSKKEFEEWLEKGGFITVESVPIALMDGIYHDISERIVPFRHWTFYPNLLARVLNYVLGIIPFFHNHMHLCVVRK